MKSEIIVEALKNELKRRGITYEKLSKKIKLSEAAVKRLFSQRNFSLRRLDEICLAAEIDLAELVKSAATTKSRLDKFPIEIEEQLAIDPQLMLLLYCALMRYPIQKIQKHLKIDKIRFYQLARSLEKLGLLKVLPNNEIQLLASKSTRWSRNGPLVKRYGDGIRQEFFRTDFSGPNEHQDFLTGTLSEDSFRLIKRKLNELFRQFDELSEMDAMMGEDHTQVYWLHSGIRPWGAIQIIQRQLFP